MSRVPAALAGRAELVLAALVVAAGIVVLVDTVRLEAPITGGVVGPKFFPYVVSSLLLVVGAWLAVDVLRGGHGRPEAEEDVDPSATSDWRAVAGITVAFAVHVALLQPAGWPVAGAVLFWGVAVSLGAPLLRAAGVAVVLSGVVFVVFDVLLEVPLPAGALEGVL